MSWSRPNDVVDRRLAPSPLPNTHVHVTMVTRNGELISGAVPRSSIGNFRRTTSFTEGIDWILGQHFHAQSLELDEAALALLAANRLARSK